MHEQPRKLFTQTLLLLGWVVLGVGFSPLTKSRGLVRLRFGGGLSGPLNRLNAILSLLHPSTAYGTPPLPAIASAIARPYLALLPRTGRISEPPRSKPLRWLNRAIVVL